MKHFFTILLLSFSGIVWAQPDASDFWNQLTDEDVYELTMFSQGCFHTESKTVTITRNGDSFISQFQEQGKDKQSKMLNTSELVLIDNLRAELSSKPASIGLCTTSTSYIVKLNGKMLTTFVDSSCSGWNGYSKLIQQLFPKTDMVS
mgnify:CR=1 FL=1